MHFFSELHCFSTSVMACVPLLLLLLLVAIAVVEAVNLQGFASSSRCRSGPNFVCPNIPSTTCCDFQGANMPVLGVQFENIRPGQWMATWAAGAGGASGCGERIELKENLHRSTKSSRCLSNGGRTMTGASWHKRRPIDSFASLDSSSFSENNSTCTNVVKARPMTWNSTLQDFVEGHF
ncbi:hypothetical protein Mapa_016947 [Marchantia paleacea]|nr:hypothetical protein Mapa_016947 [Marchantia paleacea]